MPSVTAVALNQAGKIMLIPKIDNNACALPGGGIDVGESAPAAAVRETKEETGFDVEQFSICFHALITGDELRTSSESKEVAFVPPSELNMHPPMRMRIDHGLASRIIGSQAAATTTRPVRPLPGAYPAQKA